MLNGGTTIHTADGSSVNVTPRGLEFDLHVRDAAGRTVATVVMNQDDLDALYEEMDAHTTVEWEAA
jgi:3-deoxy-D-arabino-heptulosonate 7-phosphate (DAHP) synthase